MSKNGKSVQGAFGTIHHYDARGRKVGRSEPGVFGGYTNYDAKGNKIGRSDPGIFGSYNHYDTHGRKTGRNDPGMFGSYQHRDARGKPTGSSNPGAFGSYHHNDSQGCYIATSAYGSYDCPQVWTLRRFRDNSLASSAAGRLFIRTYYAISPTIVKWFGNATWFRAVWCSILTPLVELLNEQGVEDTPYNDKNWR